MRPQDDERQLASMWAIGAGLSGLAAGATSAVLAWPVTYVLSHAPAPAEAVEVISAYFANLVTATGYILDVYVQWFQAEMARSGVPPTAWMIAAGIAVIVFAAVLALNPYSFARTEHGSARVATYRDVKRRKMMAKTGIPLGQMEGGGLQEWIKKKSFLASREEPLWGTQRLLDWAFSSALVRNEETLSCLTLAPPGTGKTVQLISNILADWPDKGVSAPCPCIIVNDPKGEIYEATAGWRSQLGPVFRLDWGDPRVSARWNPLSPLAYPGGEDLQKTRGAILEALRKVYKAPEQALTLILREQRDGGESWLDHVIANPTRGGEIELVEGARVRESLEVIGALVFDLQSSMAAREKHIDRLRTVLVPESVGPHWCQTGREFLSGAIGYSMARADRLNYEPTFGQLLDDLAGMTRDGGFRDFKEVGTGETVVTPDGVREIKEVEVPEEKPLDENGNEDLSAAMLDKWLKECRDWGYPDRVYNDLYATRLKPDKERGSVISTAGAGINIFKAATVRAVTSTCDFRLRDVRGIDGKPASFYVTVALEDAESLGKVTGLFFETVAAFALSQKKADFKGKVRDGLFSRRTKGRPILIMADEFWTLPPLDALLQIPAFGRGQWLMLEIVGQNRGQIGIKYRQKGGEDVVRALEGSMSYRRNLTQTDVQSAKVISESIGNRTVKQVSTGRQLGMGDIFSQHGGGKGLFDRNENVSYQAKPLFEPSQIMSMEKLDPSKAEWGFQLIQTTALGMNRPIVCRPIVWFKHPVLRGRANLEVRPHGPVVEDGAGSTADGGEGEAASAVRRAA